MGGSESQTFLPLCFVAFTLAIPCCAFCFRTPDWNRAPDLEAGLVVPVSPAGLESWKRLGFPGSWMNLNLNAPCSSTPAGLKTPGHCGA